MKYSMLSVKYNQEKCKTHAKRHRETRALGFKQ
jgi:hypothetical protein